MDDPFQLETYEYLLPTELIAQEPPADRSSARLLVVNRQTGGWSHQRISDLPQLLSAGDCLVLNNTRVAPARLVGFRLKTGGKWEGLFLRPEPAGDWQVIGRTRGRLNVGETVAIPAPDAAGDRLMLKLLDRLDGGVLRMAPILTDGTPNEPWPLLNRYGQVPLPPYIRRGTAREQDRDRYQTVYARQPGSVAAPTAGLHFTHELLGECRDRGIDVAEVTLHVGLGTFRPVTAADIRQHAMHAEWCQVPAETAARLGATRQRGGRIVAVGTTSLRTLESAVSAAGWTAWEGETQLFIYPPFQFRAVDVLLTNFHLPKSTLLMLVSAFAGLELTRRAYAAAIEERYRFFSYGDAMLIL